MKKKFKAKLSKKYTPIDEEVSTNISKNDSINFASYEEGNLNDFINNNSGKIISNLEKWIEQKKI